MKERPILFSTETVKAILEGRKTQTRRIVRLKDFMPSTTLGYDWEYRNRRGCWNSISHNRLLELCPYGQPGDILYVKETFYAWGHWTRVTTTGINSVKREHHFHDLTHSEKKPYLYEDCPPEEVLGRWGLGYHKRPSIFMPRAASRILLEVTDRRVETLNDIAKPDVIKEGVEVPLNSTGIGTYAQLWEDINEEGSWDKNPWVWVITFKSLKP